MKTVPRAGADRSLQLSKGPVNCGPRGLPYGRHSLYHNNGDGTFTDVTAASGIGKVEGGYRADRGAQRTSTTTAGPTSTSPAIRLPACCFTTTTTGHSRSRGSRAAWRSATTGWSRPAWALAIGDFRLDGNLHIFKTHFADDTPAGLRQQRKGQFSRRDASLRPGVETRFVGWGTGIADLDNNGNPDIFWVTGGIYPEVEKNYRTSLQTRACSFETSGSGQFEELIEQAGPGVRGARIRAAAARSAISITTATSIF